MKLPQTDEPYPGTQEAIDAGCTCPVLDNAHGKGYGGLEGVYCYSAGCPVHWRKKMNDPLEIRIGDRTHGATLSECEQWAEEVILLKAYVTQLEGEGYRGACCVHKWLADNWDDVLESFKKE